jgi:iron complex transport system ATP-binding protein
MGLARTMLVRLSRKAIGGRVRPETPKKRALPMMMPQALADAPLQIELDDIAVAIEGKLILKGVSARFPARGVIGLVGQNGSGKSTLLKVLARQETPSRGDIRFAGQPIESLRSRAFAREVAYLPQHLPPAPGLTVRELVAFGRYPWHGALGRFRAEDEAKVDAAMALTDTAHYAGRFVDSLSGGERQRCWLAMMLAQDAKILLLDEPISALDVGHQVSVLRMIRDICTAKAIAAIIVVHDVNLAARYCDRLIALKAGRLHADAAPADLMTSEMLTGIFDAPIDVMRLPASGAVYSFVRDDAAALG